MSRKRTVKLPDAFRLDQIVLPVILGLLSIAAFFSCAMQGLECNIELQCLECRDTVNNCTKCADYFGLFVDPPNPTKCADCGSHCKSCVIGQVCQKCDIGFGPIFSNSTTGSCGPCVSPQDNCADGCDIRGAGCCDGCAKGFGLTNANTVCSPCISNCLSCDTNITYCDVCSASYYFYPNRTCGRCSDHCNRYRCQRNGPGKCDRCDDGYGLMAATNTCTPCSPNCNVSSACDSQYTCKGCNLGYGRLPNGTCDACAPNCSTYGCAVNGARKCDRCDLGFALTSTNTCTPICAPNCTTCAVNGPWKCDQCYPGFAMTSMKNCTPICSPNCNVSVGCNFPNSCIKCNFGYGMDRNGLCTACSPNCAIGCNYTGAYKCDQCDTGYGLTAFGSCEAVLTTHVSSGTAESSRNPGITSSFVYFWASTTTTWTTPVTGLPSIGGDITCSMLEVGLGLGVPCGFIIIVLLIVITVMCVQNRSLREYKIQSQESRQNHTILYSTASIATLQPPLTQYQHLKTQNTERAYEGIDRYDTISTTETETTGHYETPLN